VYWNLRGVLAGIGKGPWQVRFNRVYFTIFRAKVWKKRLIFVAGNSNKLQKIGFGRKHHLGKCFTCKLNPQGEGIPTIRSLGQVNSQVLPTFFPLIAILPIQDMSGGPKHIMVLPIHTLGPVMQVVGL
jgi:hypothetical protein